MLAWLKNKLMEDQNVYATGNKLWDTNIETQVRHLN